jgi:Lhr-like helicase
VVCGKPFVLTEFQLRLWEELHRNREILVTAPTSAGKSFAVKLFLADRVANGGEGHAQILCA